MIGRRLRLFGRAGAPGRTDPGAAGGGSDGSVSDGRGSDGSVSYGSGSAVPQSERAVVRAADLAPVLTIDALGRKCPIPIIMLAEQIRDVPLGAIVAVLADDPAAYTDVPSWCVMKAHEFAGYEELTRGWALFIRRAV
jgi:tRNA 2-thiouridine synthesizing protein A